MVSAQEFLKDFTKELINCDPMDRRKIVEGWASHLEARDLANRRVVLESAESLERQNPGIVIGPEGWRKLAREAAGLVEEVE